MTHPSIRIDLGACETMALSLPDETARRASVVGLCEALGLSYRVLDAIRSSPGRIGCGLSHLRALRLSSPDQALLILEDDVGAGAFRPILEAPADADAVYLGASIYGALDLVDYVGFTHMLAADPVDGRPDLLRPYNLLGTHAILYLTERFKAAAAEAIVSSLADADWEHDKAMAKLQETYNVYALRQPMFYQAAHLQKPEIGQHQEDVTKIVLEPPGVGAVIAVGLGERSRSAGLVRADGRLRWRWLDESRD